MCCTCVFNFVTQKFHPYFARVYRIVNDLSRMMLYDTTIIITVNCYSLCTIMECTCVKQMMNEVPGASNLNLYFTHSKAKQTTKSSKFYVINNMSNTYKTRFSSRKNPKKNCVRIKWLDKQWRYSIGARENFHTEIWRNDFDVGYSQSCNINFSLMESCFSATFTLQKRCLCERSFPKMSK